MTTFDDVVEDVLAILRGYVRHQEESTHLAVGVDSDDLTWTVADVSRLSPGRAECGTELVYIDSRDASTNQITVAPYGRGMDGTTATSHSQSAQVVNNPKFPRMRVQRGVNDTLLNVAGTLFGVDVEVFTTVAGADSYELPEEAINVIAVRLEVSSDLWEPVGSWRFDAAASVSTFSSGKAIVTGNLPSGLQLEVQYSTDPRELSTAGEDFTNSLLPESCRDVIVFGAAWRLLSAVDPGHLDVGTIGAAAMDSHRQPGEGTQLSTQMYRMFQQRLKEERAKLYRRYPASIHYTGWA